MFEPKIMVEIVSEKGTRRKKCIDEGNRILIKKGKGVRGDPSVTADYDKDCILFERRGIPPFRKLHQKLVWKEGNRQCVKFYGDKVDTSRPDPRGYFEAGALKNAGSTLQKVQVPLLFYLMIGIVLAVQVIQILILRGNLRL